MLIEKNKFPDKPYLESMRDKKCLICFISGCVGHHLGHKKYDDRLALELCGEHHAGFKASVHSATSEARWWAEMAPDIVMAAMKLWAIAHYEEEHGDG